MPAIFNKAVLKPVFQAMQSARVDLIGISDSNQVHNSDGWDEGWQYALLNANTPAVMYGTGLISANENAGQGAGVGHNFNAFSNGSPLGALSGAPAALDGYMNVGAGSMFPGNYCYVSGTLNGAPGLFVDPGSVDLTAPLIGHFWVGFGPGMGSFTPGARYEGTPNFSTIALGSSVSCAASNYAMGRVDLQLPADPTRTNFFSFRASLPGGTNVVGPWFGTWMSATNPNAQAGFRYSTLDFRSSQPLRVMANDVAGAHPKYLSHFLQCLRSGQRQSSKYFVFTVNSGLNDRNDAANQSIGPNGIMNGDSAGAFYDNGVALIRGIESVWKANGWPLTELYFLLMPSHPVSNPDDAKLIAYRTAAQQLAAEHPRTASVDLSQLYTSTQIAANGWYYSDGTQNHLTAAGYQNLATAVVNNFLS